MQEEFEPSASALSSPVKLILILLTVLKQRQPEAQNGLVEKAHAPLHKRGWGGGPVQDWKGLICSGSERW